MKKKILLALCLAAIMTVLFAVSINAAGLVQTVDVSATEEDNVTAYVYAYDDSYNDFYAIISGTGKMKDFTSSTIPNVCDITSATFGEGITHIGSSTFEQGFRLKSVTLPSTLESIGNYAFMYCYELTEVTIPSNVTKLGGYAFDNCISLQSINIPESVTSVGPYCFNRCEALKEITIPSSVTYVGFNAFGSCEGIVIKCEADSCPDTWDEDWRIYLDECTIKWHYDRDHTFVNGRCACGVAEPLNLWDVSLNADGSVKAYLYNDAKNEGYYKLVISGEGQMKNWNYSNRAPWHATFDEKIKTIIVEEGVTSIGLYAFADCIALTDVKLPNSLVTIESGAFRYCEALTAITIPDNVEVINAYVFEACSALKSISLSSKLKTIGQSAFRLCEAMTSIAIPEGVTEIGMLAFNGCTLLESIVIPDSVTEIGMDTFFMCRALTSVTFGSGVKSIGNNAFFGCTSLKEIIIPDGVTSIGSSAFYWCNALEMAYIPDSVTSIGQDAFFDSENLILCCEAESKPSGWHEEWNGTNVPVFWGFKYGKWDISATENDSVTAVMLPSRMYEGFYILKVSGTGAIMDWGWGDAPWYADYIEKIAEIEISNGITSFGKYNFQGCRFVSEIEIPSSVTAIGQGAFEGCAGIVEITVPNSVVSMAAHAFTCCYGLKTVIFEENSKLEILAANVFAHDYHLQNIILPRSIRSIENNVFEGCAELPRIILPIEIETVGENAFTGCLSLTIYCEAESKPSGWHEAWNPDPCDVVWDYEYTLKEMVFTFKGYSFGWVGQISFGYDIDYEAKAVYEELTGKTLEIGVVFAGYDNLGGKQPLDENGKAITLDVGKVVKADLTDFMFPRYDFTLFDVIESIKGVKLVVSAYIYDGESVKYVQSNGLSDTVGGVSYNEAENDTGAEDDNVSTKDDDDIL